MSYRTLVLIAMIAALLLTSGCCGNSHRLEFQCETMLDQNWGKSVEAAKSSQILNPQAGENLDPVVGLDGQAAERNLEQYRQDSEEQAPQSYTINLETVGTR